MHYFLLNFIFVKKAATNNADNAATIIYALKGIKWYPKVAIKPDTNITITFLIFLKSLISKARKVMGIANFNPNSSGTIDPKNIPPKVEICQIVQQVTPPPNKW